MQTAVRIGRVVVAFLAISIPAQSFAGVYYPAGDEGVDDYYIVVLDPEVPDTEAEAEQLATKFNAQVAFVYRELYPAFEARMNEQQAIALAAEPSVKSIYQDRRIGLSKFLSTPVDWCYDNPGDTNLRTLPPIPPCGPPLSCAQALSCPQPGSAPGDSCIDNWGLDRIDQVFGFDPADEEFNYRGAGTGVRVYTIDGGIRGTNREFLRAGTSISRVEPGVNTSTECVLCPPPPGPGEVCCSTANQDCFLGHGTHVAGIIGGRTFGAAKDVTLIPFRFGGFIGTPPCSVTPTAEAYLSGFNRSLELLLQFHISQLPTAVVNMSVNDETGEWHDVTNPDTQLVRDSIIALASRDNILLVQSAGNQGNSGDPAGDACKYSFGDESAYSGSDAEAIARIVVVAGYDPELGRFDASPALASNWGPCVDVWAPASDIVSAGGHAGDPNNNRVCRLTGTSMAAPHVAGVAALLLEEAPNTSPEQLKASLIEWGTYGTLGVSGSNGIGTGSPNVRVRRAQDAIFEDGFNWDRSRWFSSVIANGGTLSICSQAAMPQNTGQQPDGSPNGLCVGLPGNSGAQAYVVDHRPAAETSYFAQFFVGYSDLTLQPSASFVIFDAVDSAGAAVLRVRLRGDGRVRVTAFDNSGAFHSTEWIEHGLGVSSGPLTLSWQAGSPGSVTVSANYGTDSSVTLENGLRRIDQVRLGALAAVASDMTGIFHLDTFGSWRDGVRGSLGFCHPAAETIFCPQCCHPQEPPGGEG